MDSDRPRKDHTAALTVLISVLTTAVLVGAAWGALGERARIDNGTIAELKTKVEQLERERESAVRMDEQLKRIALDVSELKGDVKTLDAKLSTGKRR